MPRLDYYRVLGVSRDATDEDIKKAYRKLVFQHHPDRNPNSTQAEDKIREINSAYEIIGDPESRRTYDRLHWGDEPRAEAADPAFILDEMEKKLSDEGRKEIFAALMKDVPRIKAELKVVRSRTVAHQGYDSFKESIIAERASEVMTGFVTEEMEARKQRLVEVAVQMMVAQGVVKRGDEGGIRALRGRLEDMFHKGRVTGFIAALELLYERH
ncbi:MAG TPA: DnaJ domain-containing protein [Nitrospiraceae bacterium]|jgi:molecular chaperone DnaJ|nr:DnaJ domain-containing protein [Nitrospiraceae bacterium]